MRRKDSVARPSGFIVGKPGVKRSDAFGRRDRAENPDFPAKHGQKMPPDCRVNKSRANMPQF
jgi:hypothetical protein